MASSPDPISTIQVVHTATPDLERSLDRLVDTAVRLAESAAAMAAVFARVADLLEKELDDGDH